MKSEPVLVVEDLRTWFHTDEGEALAVDGVSFSVNAGETLALVGESGCGKSVTALSLLRLIASPPGRIVSGRILLQGQDLVPLSEAEMRKVRGNRISMIFQEPMTSLNPVFRVGDQLCAPLMLHQGLSRTEARAEAVNTLARVGIPSPEERIDAYPHQMSGGMLQRVMIAMALACNPALLIADEPTTALDVTIQAQILSLLRDLQRESGTAMLLITHDLGVVAEAADRVAIMYAGKIVEEASARDLFSGPLHPYAKGLFHAVPRLKGERGRLYSIPGQVPAATAFPKGCRFHPRCEYAKDICRQTEPQWTTVGDGRRVACWLYGEGGEATEKNDEH
jgi:peptide/nickel transport system ATP-binding protein/oligopeptide transport system ATP-binding protein